MKQSISICKALFFSHREGKYCFNFKGILYRFRFKTIKRKSWMERLVWKFQRPLLRPPKRDLKLDRVNNTCVVDWLKFCAAFLARFGPEIDGETPYKKSCRWILQCRTCEKKHQIILEERNEKTSLHVYSQTCIRRICIKKSPSIKRSLTKVPKIVFLYYCKSGLY